jgi:hypothetical protein
MSFRKLLKHQEFKPMDPSKDFRIWQKAKAERALRNPLPILIFQREQEVKQFPLGLDR